MSDKLFVVVVVDISAPVSTCVIHMWEFSVTCTQIKSHIVKSHVTKSSFSYVKI